MSSLMEISFQIKRPKASPVEGSDYLTVMTLSEYEKLNKRFESSIK